MKFLHRHQVKPIDDKSFTIYIVDYVCDISVSAILSELQPRVDAIFYMPFTKKHIHAHTQSVIHIFCHIPEQTWF